MNLGKCASRLFASTCSVMLIGVATVIGGCGANEPATEDLAAMKGRTLADIALSTYQNTVSRGSHNGVDVDPGAPKE